MNTQKTNKVRASVTELFILKAVSQWHIIPASATDDTGLVGKDEYQQLH